MIQASKGNVMETQIAEKSSNVPSTELNDWGYDEDVSASDILIPRILLMQKTSGLVDEERAEVGDIVNSISGEVVCKLSLIHI